MEQMMEYLVPVIEKTDANVKEMRAEMRAGREHLKEEMLAKFDAHHERMMARIDSQLEN
jgi:hypothetical protein